MLNFSSETGTNSDPEKYRAVGAYIDNTVQYNTAWKDNSTIIYLLPKFLTIAVQ